MSHEAAGEAKAEIELRLVRLLEERLEQVEPEESLRWLALLPEWTEPLALACEFPTGDEGLEPLVERIQRLGLCRVRRERDIAGEETMRFWMPSTVRSSLLARWQLDAGLNAQIDEIAANILSVGEKERVSAGIRRWAELARAEMGAPVRSTRTITGDFLAEQIEKSLSAEKPTLAGEWVFAAKALGQPLGAEMEAAAVRAQRQLNFYYRRVQDARYLEHFVEREEQIDELQMLFASDRHWALHFIGLSGVGKTMLLRYLTSRSFDSPRIVFASRVDFDYVDPRYPLESPARLLHELGEGLAIDLEDSAQEALLRNFREAVTAAEAIRHDPGQAPLQALQTREFERVVSTFADFVNGLKPPVVLMLDTCEELAKLHPPNEDVPSIRATFQIIEQVQKRAEGIRVIFAGRRWLTSKAANMQRSDKDAPKSIMCMEDREYMRMYEVRGFTKGEVVDYLAKVCGTPPEPTTLTAVLKLAKDEGRVPGIDDLGEEESRYSPSDVWLLGGWLAEDPVLFPESVAKGNFDAFVESRIFARLDSPEILAAVPAAVVLERFDAAMIEPMLGADPDVRVRVFSELIEQEWTHLEGGPEPRDVVIGVDRSLLARLKSYFSGERQLQLDEAQAELSRHLGKLIERAPAGASPPAIEAALRLLPVEEAARRFDRLARRVASEEAWSWAEDVCSGLLSPERPHPLREQLEPSVGALYVAALKHRKSSASLESLWKTVAVEARKHPDRAEGEVLEMRGELGALAAAAANGGFPVASAAILAQGVEVLGRIEPPSPLAPALLATIEAMIDGCEERGYRLPLVAVESAIGALLERFADDEPLCAHILALEGRMRVANGDWVAADACFEQVEGMGLRDGGAARLFSDWVPPGSIGHRVLLELLRFRLARETEDEALIERCEREALDSPGGVDAAQLLSLVIQARLAGGDLGEGRLYEAQRYEAALDGYDLLAPAHRVAPPLFVSVAEAWFASGHPGPALSLLAAREQVATSRRTDEDATRAAALGTVRILRRLRLPHRLELVSTFSVDEDEELRTEALAAGSLVASLQPPPQRRRDHAAWRARNLLDADRKDLAQVTEPTLQRLFNRPEVDEALDHIEAGIIHRREGSSWRGPLFALGVEKQVIDEAATECLAPEIGDPLARARVRMQLRIAALSGEENPPSASGRDRVVGELALEEGELLALRLPRPAAWLLALAEERLAACGDRHGAFVAALRGVIAEIHDEREQSARARRDAIIDRYLSVRRADPGLPHPGHLLEGQKDDDSPWREWTTRLAAYLSWCDEEPLDRSIDDALFGDHPELTLTPAARPIVPAIAEGHPSPLAATPPLDVWLRPWERGRNPQYEVAVGDRSRSLLVRFGRLFARRVLDQPFRALPLFEDSPKAGSPTGLARALGLRDEPWTQPIRLTVTSDLAPLDWEWRLAGHLLWRKGLNPNRMPDIWRVRPPGAVAPSDDRWSREVVAVCSAQWRPFIAGSVEDPGRLRVQERSGSPETAGHAGAAIAIGSPVFTRAGWRLRLDDDELFDPLDDPSRPRSQDLVSPDGLARQAPVVVVFGRPSGSRPTADRHTAEALRGLANETFLAGAYAAITVPALPPERTAEAIRFLTAALAKEEDLPDTGGLLLLVNGLRAIAGGRRQIMLEASDDEDRQRDIRLALDVCLFAPSPSGA